MHILKRKRHVEPAFEDDLDNAKTGASLTKRLACGAGGTFLIIAGLRRKGMSRAALTAGGGKLLLRGIGGGTGRKRSTKEQKPQRRVADEGKELPYGRGVKIRESIVVNKPAIELYNIWRNFEILPAFMPHLESVEVIDEDLSHWVLKTAAGPTIEWDAEVIADREGEMIGWRSVNRNVVAHAGSVRFEPRRGGNSTRVVVALQYNPTGGEAGALAARVFGTDPQKRIQDDLARFRDFAESVNLGVLDNLIHRTHADRRLAR